LYPTNIRYLLAAFGSTETHHFFTKALPRESGMEKSERVNLTDRKLKSLKQSEREDDLGHFDTWDSIVPGLGVRTRSVTGRRTFVLLARYPGSKNTTRRALGAYGELTLEQAREKARKWLELVRKGIDPAIAEEEDRQAALRQQANTFAAVAEKYLETKVIGKQRKGNDVARDFRGVFIAIWGERPITSIAKGEVVSLIEAIRDNGTAATLAAYRGGRADKRPAPGHARNLLGYLKTFFAWAAARDEFGLTASPCTFIKGADIIGIRESDDRTLDDAELRAFWRAATEMPYPFGPIYRLLLLSGLRLNEVADAVWSEFDLAKGI
jgi:hypothetical protein